MDLLDLIIILAAIAYGIGGFRNGAVVGVFSMIGFFGGAIVGAQLASPLGRTLANGRAQIPVAIICVLFISMIGQLLGVWIAGHVRARLVKPRGRPVDAGVGSALGVISVLLVAWMVAVPLASSPYPSLAGQAQHSRIVRGVNDVMPGNIRTLYGSLRTFLDQSGFPPVLGDLPSTNLVSVAPPDKTLSPQLAQAVARAHASVFKILGDAPSCNRGIEGTGFAYAPHRVVTNAHVVAGTSQVHVNVNGDLLAAKVVVFDPRRDVAVLDVPSLTARTLPFASAPATSGESAAVLGYPEDGPFTVKSARVRSQTTMAGSDIYGTHPVTRKIYSVRAVVRSGNSGGPLLSGSGTVLGIVFATALDSPDTGFVLTDSEIAPDVEAGRSADQPVSTGGCTPG